MVILAQIYLNAKKKKLFLRNHRRDENKYFDTIHFSLLPGNRNFSEEILKLPAHYFSHIFAIDT